MNTKQKNLTQLASVMTIAGIAEKYDKDSSTIRQYLLRHREEMLEHGVIRKSGKVWLILATEAARIWG